jgi:hypothetical protein
MNPPQLAASKIAFEDPRLAYFLSQRERIEVRAACHQNTLTPTLSRRERVVPVLGSGSV